MVPSPQPPRPPRRLGPAFRSGRPVLGSFLRKEHEPQRLSLQSGRTRPKASTTEPIEANPQCHNELHRFLINRSHWSYLAAAEAFTAKKRPIFVHSVPPRTRIDRPPPAVVSARPCASLAGAGVRGKTSKAGMCNIFNKNDSRRPASPRTRIWCEGAAGRRRRRGFRFGPASKRTWNAA